MLMKYINLWNTWQSASTNRKIFSAAFIVTVMTLMVKLVAAGKEIVVADYFGTGEMVDAFLIAFMLPMFAINVLAGSFSVAMMPAYIRIRDNAGKIAAQRLFSSVMLLAVLFLVAVALALAALAPWLLPLLGSGFNEQTMALTLSLYYWLLPVLVLTGTGHLYASVINADDRFAVVALTPVITPMFSVILLLSLAHTWGIHALAVGILIGAAVELVIIARVATRRGILLLPRWCGMTDEVRIVMGQYAPMIAGAFLMSSTVLVDQSMATLLESGSVATLNYANKVTGLLLGIFAMALGTAVMPHFSRLVAADDWTGIRHSFRTYACLILLTSVPITVLLFLFSEPIINLLFERGAFSAEDTRLVGQTQAFYVLQVPFYILGILGVRLINAMARNDVLMKIYFVNLVVNIVGNYLLMQWIGLSGIALSTSVVYVLSTTIIYLFLFSTTKK